MTEGACAQSEFVLYSKKRALLQSATLTAPSRSESLFLRLAFSSFPGAIVVCYAPKRTHFLGVVEGRLFLPCKEVIGRRKTPLLCIFSGENTNTTKDFSLVVFFCRREPLYIIPLRIVGSGFCPMVRGLPRAMLAPDANVERFQLSLEKISPNELLFL